MHMIVVLLLGLCCVPSTTTGATGDESTDVDRRFQGGWELRSAGSGSSTGTLRIEGRAFEADTVHGSYQGTLAIRPDASPAQIDVTVERCDCNLLGKTSEGIYRQEDDGTIVFAWPAPDEPRPTSFDGLDASRHMIERATRVVDGDVEAQR